MEASAQSSWLESAKSAATKTWQAAQRAFIYDDRPLQGYADPVRQMIRERVSEENQRFHGAHEAAIKNRQNGQSCYELNIHIRLEKNMNDKCYIRRINSSCLEAFNLANGFSSNETLIQSNVRAPRFQGS